ncbi:DUF885 family protein [Phenylobacterium sp.]|uniref:DUF885 family protein n=1 Tax=Phenylobacterium sp. TaxID=1871053 RepID=UPI002CBDCD94|nr:DUF885 family protein [Phenylobacterium sp.]HLZ75435.1 DUF885 family protein [Phenylobacterium sp.]
MQTRRTLLASGLGALAAPAMAAPAGAYRSALAAAYGGPVDPAGAHQSAQAAAAAAQARLDALLRGQGLTAGGPGARLRTLAKDPRWLYPDSEAGRDHAVREMNTRLSAFRPNLRRALGDLPIAPAAVRRMSAADVAAGKGGYREAPADGKPGAYYIDLRDIRARPSWTLPSVGFHEVTPGHLLQLPLQGAACPPEARIKASGAYVEAWAIYAEQLCCDLGAYAGDPLGEIGYLQWRLFRLGRIVADTGLHAMGWSRDQAVAALRDLQGFGAAFITIEADVARIAAQPGKCAAEGLGALSLATWRPADRGRWPAFHKAVLADGPFPFGELEARVKDKLLLRP